MYTKTGNFKMLAPFAVIFIFEHSSMYKAVQKLRGRCYKLFLQASNSNDILQMYIIKVVFMNIFEFLLTKIIRVRTNDDKRY